MGFLQKEEWGTLSITEAHTGKEVTDRVKVPPMHVLIEACGDRFMYLENHLGARWIEIMKGAPQFTHESWLAVGTLGNSVKGFGQTPEEAVANLWLELNTK